MLLSDKTTLVLCDEITVIQSLKEFPLKWYQILLFLK